MAAKCNAVFHPPPTLRRNIKLSFNLSAKLRWDQLVLLVAGRKQWKHGFDRRNAEETGDLQKLLN